MESTRDRRHARVSSLPRGSIARTFGVSWQDTLDRGGIVVGNEIDIVIDVEAVLED